MFKRQSVGGSKITITVLPGVFKPVIQNAAAVATSKSLQSCPTLCDPRDSSPPGFRAQAPRGNEKATDRSYRAASCLHNYRKPSGSNGDPALPRTKLKKKKNRRWKTLKDEFKQASGYSPTQFLGWLSITQTIK